MLRRYQELIDWVDIVRPRSIIEVGAWNGEQAVRMIRAATSHYPMISYTGYDMFECGDDALDADELNRKSRANEYDTRTRIEQNCPNAHISLIKGNTNETLSRKVFADFAYIDGGHSIKTIANDYAACADCPVVILDDYYFALRPNDNIDTRIFGCNTLVDCLAAEKTELLVGVFANYDYIENLGAITMAFIIRRDALISAHVASRRSVSSSYRQPSKDELIDAVYRGLLGRPPDSGGRKIWRERLETRSLESMLSHFVKTEEFRNRFELTLARPPG